MIGAYWDESAKKAELWLVLQDGLWWEPSNYTSFTTSSSGYDKTQTDFLLLFMSFSYTRHVKKYLLYRKSTNIRFRARCFANTHLARGTLVQIIVIIVFLIAEGIASICIAKCM